MPRAAGHRRDGRNRDRGHAEFLDRFGVGERTFADHRRERPLEDLQLHGVGEILARVEDGGRIAGVAERGGHGIPAEAVEMDSDAVVGGLLHAGDHVGVAGDENHV